MSSIPGAHASLGFGRKRVEFYASPGVTAGSSERRRGEHEVRDVDGHIQTLRLSRPDTPLDNGETVTVLRLQSGPDHDSRPVALINHDRKAWTRTAPDATGVLGRSGITRAVNWWLSMLAFIAAGLAFAWPDMRLFMLEVDPALFASLPEFNLFAVVAAQAPALPGFDLAAIIPGFGAFADLVGGPQWLTANMLAFALLLTAAALFAYFARSWRVIWVPVYILGALVAGLAIGGATPLMPAMTALGGVAFLFSVGGMINRIRDAARLEGRIARLSENLLRNPPQETVSAPAAAGAALAASAAQADAAEAVSAEADDVATPATDAAADDTPADDEPPADDELPSDDDLAAARAENERENGDTPAPALAAAIPLAAAEAPAEARDDDRDMVLPPPPPIANRSVNDRADSGEAGEPDIAEAPAVATLIADEAPDAPPAEEAPDVIVQTPAEAAPPESVSEPPVVEVEEPEEAEPEPITVEAEEVDPEPEEVEDTADAAIEEAAPATPDDNESDPFLTTASDPDAERPRQTDS